MTTDDGEDVAHLTKAPTCSSQMLSKLHHEDIEYNVNITEGSIAEGGSAPTIRFRAGDRRDWRIR